MGKVKEGLDSWFLTIARYSALCAGVGLFVYAGAIDRFRNPALLPAATGLILSWKIAK